MNQIIDISTYLPAESSHIRLNSPKPRPSGRDILMVLEAIVTGIIGISMMVGVGAFLMML